MDHPDRSLAAFQELASNYEITVDQELRKFWGVSYSGFVEQLLQFAAPCDQDAVLDLATGTGLIPQTLASRCGAGGPIVGLDITYTALAVGKKNIPRAGSETPVSLTCASALALPFAPASFDGVICALATHHLDRDGLLGQVHSVLKPGGQFILADVVASPAWRFPGVKAGLRLAAFGYFFFTVSPARAWVESEAVAYVHTEEEWVSALRKHGFLNVRVRRPPVRRAWAASAIMIAATKNPASNAAER